MNLDPNECGISAVNCYKCNCATPVVVPYGLCQAQNNCVWCGTYLGSWYLVMEADYGPNNDSFLGQAPFENPLLDKLNYNKKNNDAWETRELLRVKKEEKEFDDMCDTK